MSKNEFKIVKILDQYSVVINAGKEDDISQGDKFQILEGDGNEVIDLDTNELLGELTQVKETVEVTEVYERFCVCYGQNKMSLENTFGSFNDNIESTDFFERDRLNVNLSQITGRRKNSNNKIQLGDLARHFINE